VVDRSGGPSSEARQRWRVVFARDAAARFLAHLDAVTQWERALRRAGVPVALSQGNTPRPKLAFAAPLPLGMLGERELVDVVLAERLTLPTMRARLEGQLPAGYRLVDLFDVWLGEPAAASRLAAADYRVALRGASAAELAEAGEKLLAADSLERARPKGEGRSVAYDLRPLLLELNVADAPDPVASGAPASARMRLRHAQEGGAGRPEEVVLALGEALGRELELDVVVRERLLVADEPTRWPA
jgi:radical SAM-linked protein